jgi:hypothetical protein
MRKLLAIAAIAAGALLAPQIVLAQTSPQDRPRISIRQQVRHQLEESGFSDIRMIPQAFLVHATGPNGNPVTMLVNTDEMTMSQEANSDQDGTQTTSAPAKMTGNDASPTSPNEATQNDSNSSQPLTLSNAQRLAIWRALGKRVAQANNLNVGQVAPDAANLRAVPNSVSDQIPAIKSDDYTTVNNQLLIVHPVTKRILAIITE